MLVPLTVREFARLAVVKEGYESSRIQQMHAVSSAIAMHWVSVLPAAELSVLLAILARTLAFGRAAVRMSLKEFTSESSEFPKCRPLRYSTVSIRRAIHALSTQGLVVIYAPTADDSRNESDGRMYEIDFKTASLGAVLTVERVEARVVPPITHERPPSHPRETPYCINTELGKPNKLFVASLRSRANVEDFPEMRGNENIADVLQRVKTTSATKRATLVQKASGSPAALSMQMVQAVIDKVMERDFPALPRVIATKAAYSVLKKRLLAYKIADLEGLVEFSFANWSALATQNRMALVRDPTKAQKFKPLPLAPSFTDFAYRLPYFISAYSNRKAAQGATPAQATQHASTRERELEREIADLRRQQEASRGIIRRISSRRSAPRKTEVPAPTMPWVDALDSDWLPPAWEPTPNRKHHGK